MHHPLAQEREFAAELLEVPHGPAPGRPADPAGPVPGVPARAQRRQHPDLVRRQPPRAAVDGEMPGDQPALPTSGGHGQGRDGREQRQLHRHVHRHETLKPGGRRQVPGPVQGDGHAPTGDRRHQAHQASPRPGRDPDPDPRGGGEQRMRERRDDAPHHEDDHRGGPVAAPQRAPQVEDVLHEGEADPDQPCVHDPVDDAVELPTPGQQNEQDGDPLQRLLDHRRDDDDPDRRVTSRGLDGMHRGGVDHQGAEGRHPRTPGEGERQQ